VQRSQKTVVLGSLLAVAFGALSVFLFPLYGTAFGALVMPFLVILTLYAGPFCGGLAVGVLLLVALAHGGWMGALLILLTIPGTMALTTVLLKRKAAIQFITLHSVASMITGMVFFWVIYSLVNGSDLATDLVAFMDSAMRAALEADGGLFDAAPEMKTLFEQSLPQVYEAMKAGILPQLVFLACLSGLLGATLPVVYMRKRALVEDVSRLGLLHTWRVPRKVSLALMASYLVSLVLALVGVPGMAVVSQTVWSAVKVIYGAACLSFFAAHMRKAAMSRGARNFVLALAVLGMLVFSLLGVFGIMPFVLIGITSETMRMRAPRVPGDEDGPFGPPDPLPKPDEKDDDL